MNIKTRVKISFFVIASVFAIVGATNLVVLHQFSKSNEHRNRISDLLLVQENMSEIILKAFDATSAESLEATKKDFHTLEAQFETIQKSYEQRAQNGVVGFFVKDLFEDSFINDRINHLFKNEELFKSAFQKTITLQERSIELSKELEQLFLQESQERKRLDQEIEMLENYDILKLSLSVAFGSKEMLYQHKNEVVLQEWLSAIKALQKKFKSGVLPQYEQTVRTLGKYMKEYREIEKLKKEIDRDISKTITQNQTLSKEIEKKLHQRSTVFIENVNTVMLLIISSTLIFVIVFGYKVNRNVGLSVDEIEQKISEGLQEIQKLNQEIESTQKEVVLTMGAICETRSKETGNHVKRVAEYSKLFAKRYGLSEEEAELLRQASPMHDIGKVAIPDAILNKPGRFDDNERAIMNTHAQLGYEMLKHSQRAILKAAAIVAYEHHEKWDGSGYPRGLRGEEIHIFGRITAIADVFDALGSDRCYKKAWDDERIFALFREERGRHFEPKLVDIFFEHLDEFLAIRKSLADKF